MIRWRRRRIRILGIHRILCIAFEAVLEEWTWLAVFEFEDNRDGKHGDLVWNQGTIITTFFSDTFYLAE